MEEEKLTDDTEINVGMMEEEIVKSLECCLQNETKNTCGYCLSCPASDWYSEDDSECVAYMMKKAIDLINRQKAKIERLTEERESYKRLWVDVSDKHGGAIQENAELQKQVDGLKQEKLDAVCDLNMRIIELDNELKQAVKDKAKEILEYLKSKVIMTEIPHGSEPCEEDVEAVMWWQIEEYFKKTYNVEVE